MGKVICPEMKGLFWGCVEKKVSRWKAKPVERLYGWRGEVRKMGE